MKLSFWDILASMVMLAGLALATIFVNIFVNPYTFINPFPPPTPVVMVDVPTLTPSPRSLPELWTSTPETPNAILSYTFTPSATPSQTGTILVLPTGTPTRTRTAIPTNTSTITSTPNRSLTAVSLLTATATKTATPVGGSTSPPSDPGWPITTSLSTDSTPYYTWTASTAYSGSIDKYQISWNAASSPSCSDGYTGLFTTTNSWTVSPAITSAGSYYLCVRAVDTNGKLSNWVESNNPHFFVYSQNISKAFSPLTVISGGASTITISISNPYSTTAQTNVAFSDTFPAGMVVDTPAVFNTSGCGTPTYTPVAGAGSITFSNGTIAASGTCVVTVNVEITGTNYGGYVNTTSSVTSTEGGLGGPASATLNYYAAPSATTVAASSVLSTSATLNGTINANNASTTVTFEYGTAMGVYGAPVAATPGTVTGTTNTSVTYTLSGLAPNTPYYYRVKGVNSAGITNGAEMSFTTPKGTSTTSITSDLSSATLVGEAYTVAVTVAGSGVTPTGSVTVSDGTDSCTIAALAAGSGNCSLTSTTIGSPKTITATYAGDSSFDGSSGTTTHTVNKGNPNITVWPTASDITYGETLADSTLSGGTFTPAGTFAFTSPTTAPDAGTASYSVTFTPTDTTNYNTATGSVSVTTNKASTTTTIVSDSPDPTDSGDPYTITANVTSSGGTPTGTITVDDGTLSCTITLPDTTCDLSSTGASTTLTLTATYGGDANFDTSVSATANHDIN